MPAAARGFQGSKVNSLKQTTFQSGVAAKKRIIVTSASKRWKITLTKF